MMSKYEMWKLILETAKVIVAVVALWFTWQQVNNIMKQREDNLKTEKAKTIKELYDDSRDGDVAQIISKIDWGEIDFPIKNRDLELKLDKTLALFNHICYLYSIGSLNDTDMQMFDYRLSCIANNQKIRQYMAFLEEVYEASKAKSSFSYLGGYLKEKIEPRLSETR